MPTAPAPGVTAVQAPYSPAAPTAPTDPRAAYDPNAVPDTSAVPGAPAPRAAKPEPSPASNAVRWSLAAVSTGLLFFVLTIVGILLVVLIAIPPAVVAGIMGAPVALVDSFLESNTFDELAMLAASIFTIGCFGAIWYHLRGRAMGPRRRPTAPRPAANALAIAAVIVVSAFGMFLWQGLLVDKVLGFFPDIAASYHELVEAGVRDGGIFSVLSTVITAPIVEELCCRGIMLECLLRAFTPGWRRGLPNSPATPAPRVAIAAILLQALIFGIMHWNIVQSTYATVGGIVLGVVYWRCGDLRATMLFHMVVNGSNYLPDWALAPIEMLPEILWLPLGIVLFAAGLYAIFRLTDRPQPAPGAPSLTQAP